MENECKGCSVVNTEGCMNGLIPRISETQFCPCINCILKGICEDVCEDFEKYLELVKRL